MIDPFIGRTISKYEIVEHIGRGATADVYKAYQRSLDRYVAIKLLHPFLAEDSDFLVRFQREAKAAARLRHPNIIQVYDFDVVQDIYYLVMEFIDGLTLKTKLQNMNVKQPTLPLDESVRITRAVAKALSYAHQHDMIHRDIKPANIMIDRDGHIILTDFGTAKILSGGQHTASGVTTGTPAYASPEQVMAQPGDTRSDLYSLGVVFFQLVTGQLPYEADTGVAVFLKHLTDPIPSPRAINPALSLDVETVVFRAMAKKPEQRYQTADEFVADLDRITRGVALPAAPISFDTSPLDLSRYASTIAFENLAGADQPIDETPIFEVPPAPEPIAPAAPSTSYQLPAYTLSPGYAITEPHELPAACYLDWARAVNHFTKGYITTWLREGVDRLRAAHQHGLADDLEIIASSAESLVHRITPTDDFGRNTALQEFLLSLGAEMPVLQVAPDRVEVSPLGAEESGPPLTLTIANRERGYLFGQVVSQVPWLKPVPERFGCGAGEQCAIHLYPNALGLNAGLIENGNAIIVRSVGGEKRVAAQIEVLPAVLQTDVNALDFGTVGQGTIGTATLTITNRGQGFLIGRLRPAVPWLSVMPDHFRLSSRESITITVRADPQSLTAGNVALEQAILIDSNGGQQSLNVSLRVRSPRLKLEPAAIDFGIVDLAVPHISRNADLKIANHGLGVLMGVIKTEANWLAVEPTAFRCVTGQTQTARATTQKLQTGDYRQTVHIISNAGDADVPVRLQVIFSLEPETIVIPAGSFTRGSKGREPDDILATPTGSGDDLFSRMFRSEPKPTAKAIPAAEQPQREITLAAYAIGRYPVTNAEYAVFIANTHRRAPAHWINGTPPPGLDNHPVVNVTWSDAATYCMWLSEVTGKTYRLPTEAQWEKAARGSDRRPFPWGGRWDKHRCNTLETGLRATTPIGTFSPVGDSSYGCSDMAGNVWEWVLDWFSKDYYANSTVTENPLGPVNGAVKVMRGGSYNVDGWQARTSNRSYANRNLVSPEVGFRVASAL